MKMHLANTSEGNLIRSCSASGIAIGSDIHDGSVVVTESAVSNWPVTSLDSARAADFEDLLRYDPELVLVGTGSAQQFPDPALYAALLEQSVGIEFMTSAAACRTFNIVLLEDRRVVAALIKPHA